jgi:raffinose/stachyose/melibiose transport system permease protein
MGIHTNGAMRRFALGTVLVAVCAVMLLPIWLIFALSVKTNGELMRGNVFGLPQIAQWVNYVKAWNSADFARFFRNSVYVSALSVFGVLLLSLLGAYAMTVFRFRGRGVIMTLVVLGLLVPVELTLIPQFTNMRALGLSNTREAVILLHIAGNAPFGIFLLRGFMRGVSTALIEAARLDGAREHTTLFRVITPVIRPALIALLVMTFMWTWNNYFLSRIFLQGDKVKTLPLGLDAFRGKFTRDYVLTAAGSVIVAIPVLAVYLLFQQRMVQGMVIGALKE